MFLRYSKDVSINVELKGSSSPASLNIILLHGFTGSSNDWLKNFDLISKNVNKYSIDIIGHGKSSSPNDISYYTTKSIIDQLHYVITSLKLTDVILTGYSMGGRVAIAYVNEYPDRVKGLFLESTSPGIIENENRDQRYQDDLGLAGMIEKQGIESFINYWLHLPLFETQKRFDKDFLLELRNTKLQNNPAGLANSLRGFSTGIMPHFWDNLSDIYCKTVLLTGRLDVKFTEINLKMSSLIKNVKHIIVDNCGHNIHLENPETYFIHLNTFLDEL